MNGKLLIGSVHQRAERERERLVEHIQRYYPDQETVLARSFLDGTTPVREVMARVFAQNRIGGYVGIIHAHTVGACAEEGIASYGLARMSGMPYRIFVRSSAWEKQTIQEIITKIESASRVEYQDVADLNTAFDQWYRPLADASERTLSL